jgi:hypothetical protein
LALLITGATTGTVTVRAAAVLVTAETLLVTTTL